MDRRTGGGVKYGKTRLDFFLISPDYVDMINRVKYEGRLGADFDHKEVTLYLGRKGGPLKLTVSDKVLDDVLSEHVGYLAVYESIATHLLERDQNLNDSIVQLDLLIREKELLETLKKKGIGQLDIEQRILTNNENVNTTVNRLPGISVQIDRELTCSYGSLYEVVVINLKNKLMAIQTARDRIEHIFRTDQLNRIQYYENTFGIDSIQAEDEREKLLRMDDIDLKNRAVKFREFLDINNEKATKVFCRLGKEGGVCDDITQIVNDRGEEFVTENDRGEHIRGYYETVYKKRLDNLLSIESFLTENVVQSDWVARRRLDEVEKESLENEITMEELTKSLEESNFHSTSGWDGISFKVIRKYWNVVKFLC
jgi:hypothetical protein